MHARAAAWWCECPGVLVGEQGIPQDVKAFIVEQIDSVVQVEILLLLHGQPGRDFTADEIGRELRIDPAWARAQLVELSTRGLLYQGQRASTPEAGPEASFRYQPRSAELDRAVAGLSREYADRRVSVISLIFSKPVDKIRS